MPHPGRVGKDWRKKRKDFSFLLFTDWKFDKETFPWLRQYSDEKVDTLSRTLWDTMRDRQKVAYVRCQRWHWWGDQPRALTSWLKRNGFDDGVLPNRDQSIRSITHWFTFRGWNMQRRIWFKEKREQLRLMSFQEVAPFVAQSSYVTKEICWRTAILSLGTQLNETPMPERIYEDLPSDEEWEEMLHWGLERRWWANHPSLALSGDITRQDQVHIDEYEGVYPAPNQAARNMLLAINADPKYRAEQLKVLTKDLADYAKKKAEADLAVRVADAEAAAARAKASLTTDDAETKHKGDPAAQAEAAAQEDLKNLLGG